MVHCAANRLILVDACCCKHFQSYLVRFSRPRITIIYDGLTTGGGVIDRSFGKCDFAFEMVTPCIPFSPSISIENITRNINNKTGG